MKKTIKSKKYKKTSLIPPNNDIHYPNSTISEALCEIHFSPKETYTKSQIDEFKKILRDYPDVRQESIKNYRATVTDSSLSVNEEVIQRNILRHKQRDHILQIFPGLLTISELCYLLRKK